MSYMEAPLPYDVVCMLDITYILLSRANENPRQMRRRGEAEWYPFVGWSFSPGFGMDGKWEQKGQRRLITIADPVEI